MKLIKILVLVSATFVIWGCSEQSYQVQVKSNFISFDKPREEKYFADYIDALKRYARQQGIDDKTINIAFKDVYYIKHVVQADKNQPEKKVSLDEYLARAVSPARIKLAKQKYLSFYTELNNASLLTHVPKNYILALWGVESAYGKYQGKEDIISALSTLAFDGRRENFFTKELISALTILQNGHIKKSQFKGSWAGAMGQNQFMPSSYLTYGLDGDGDGKIDIWNNITDIFASTGNYLFTVGWNSQESWGRKIKLPNNFKLEQVGLENEKSKHVSEWLKTGIQFIDNKTIVNKATLAWVIVADENSGGGYLVYNNFRTLMHWNRSYYFAISVGMLADSLTDDTSNDKQGK